IYVAKQDRPWWPLPGHRSFNGVNVKVWVAGVAGITRQAQEIARLNCRARAGHARRRGHTVLSHQTCSERAGLHVGIEHQVGPVLDVEVVTLDGIWRRQVRSWFGVRDYVVAP